MSFFLFRFLSPAVFPHIRFWLGENWVQVFHRAHIHRCCCLFLSLECEKKETLIFNFVKNNILSKMLELEMIFSHELLHYLLVLDTFCLRCKRETLSLSWIYELASVTEWDIVDRGNFEIFMKLWNVINKKDGKYAKIENLHHQIFQWNLWRNFHPPPIPRRN